MVNLREMINYKNPIKTADDAHPKPAQSTALPTLAGHQEQSLISFDKKSGR